MLWRKVRAASVRHEKANAHSASDRESADLLRAGSGGGFDLEQEIFAADVGDHYQVRPLEVAVHLPEYFLHLGRLAVYDRLNDVVFGAFGSLDDGTDAPEGLLDLSGDIIDIYGIAAGSDRCGA